MRQAKLGAAVCAAQLLAVTGASANNIRVSNVSLTKNAGSSSATVQFDVAWENSWRVTSGPSNWDAAWVFIKYHTGDLNWKSATLDPDDADHVVPAAATLDVGLNATRGLGAFIYRAAPGAGNVNYNAVKLKWNYGDDAVSDAALVTLDVHAIEMVYVPQGSFQVGDGVARTGTSEIASLVAGGGAAGTAPPFTIASAAAMTVGTTAGSLSHTGQVAGTYRAIPATFPNGFGAYYLMKYEASQHQWAAFLNTTSLLPAIGYSYIETLQPIVPAVVPPRDQVNGRQVFFSADLPAPALLPVPVPPNAAPAIPTRPIVQAKFPDRAFVSYPGVPLTANMNTTANSLNVTVVAPFTTASLLVGQFLSSNPNIPRGAFVASITNATTFVLGGVTAATITAGAGVPTSITPTALSRPEDVTLAYLDWSGLRPMTEFEYEKAARGPVAPLAGEYAWGTADVALLSYGNPGAGYGHLAEDGLPAEAPAANYNYNGGNAYTRATILQLPAGGPLFGPCRVGMFARENYTTTFPNDPTPVPSFAPARIQSGAGYYGFMDLTGNAAELVARWNFPLASSTAPNFVAEHGDGALGANGLQNVTGWNATTPPIVTFYGLRGGSFAEAAVPVSQRAALVAASGAVGIRGARTAPVAAQ